MSLCFFDFFSQTLAVGEGWLLLFICVFVCVSFSTVLIDKDNQPKWSPSTLQQVSEEMVKSYFVPLPKGEHELDLV